MKLMFCFVLLNIIFFLSYTQADTQINEEISLKDITCTAGSLEQLYNFFEGHQYVLVGQGRQSKNNSAQNDFPDTLFLVSATMDYFHVVTLQQKKHNRYEGCITLSAREIDIQMQSPVDQLLSRNNRAHFLFLPEIPENGKCPDNISACVPWKESTKFTNQKPLLTGYEYSVKPEDDPYEEVVELKIGDQTIHPTRGALAELARKKYTLRLTNALGESKADVEAAKEIYENILLDVDHKLPLIVLSASADGPWKIHKLDRSRGLVWILLQGKEFSPFPLNSESYKKFTNSLN